MSAAVLGAVLAAVGPRVPEKVVQAQGVNLIRSIGGAAWVLGTRRRRGDHPGTMQSPGVPDVIFFLPPPPLRGAPVIGFWEVKARDGRMSREQVVFRDCCLAASAPHVTGDLDALIVFLADGGWIVRKNLAHYRSAARARVADV